MSCVGTITGSPLAGANRLFEDSIKTRASIRASVRKRDMHRHLVAVKIGVERDAHERMQLDRLALDQHRLEGLNPQAMQSRGAV